MTEYHMAPAHIHRIGASLASIGLMADSIKYDYLSDESFSPSDFLKMLENINGELVFLTQYVTQHFLSSSDAPTDESETKVVGIESA